MPASFWDIVNKVIDKSDIILEILDARMPDETRNREVEDKTKRQGKALIYVINKSDLISKENAEKLKSNLNHSVFVSSTKHQGTTILLKEIIRIANMKFPDKEKISVGVVGYPNVGKSSVINALKGRASAPSSSKSGYTKHEQLIKVTSRIYLIDTPGVFPFMEKDEIKHILTASADPGKIKDPEAAAMIIIQQLKGKVEEFYGVDKNEDVEEALEQIALAKRKLKKGNLPDTKTMSKIIIEDWQKGKISA